MIVLQLVMMIIKAEEWSVIRRIDNRTNEHGIVLASHSTKLDAILDFGFNEKTTNWVQQEYDRIKP
jgi:hypothetical protein